VDSSPAAHHARQTQKNTLITAIRKNKTSPKYLEQYEAYKMAYGFSGIKLETLMRETGLIRLE
tara:strand:- start:43826 stop:44014 length:189 start_codon:yes stop_codon:yes gene_type:complete